MISQLFLQLRYLFEDDRLKILDSSAREELIQSASSKLVVMVRYGTKCTLKKVSISISSRPFKKKVTDIWNAASGRYHYSNEARYEDETHPNCEL